jgi:hypothetical protein
VAGEHKKHLPQEKYNKKVKSDDATPKALRRLSRGQGEQTKRDAKTPQRKK